MRYRSEIDGLRAVAVLPVILFHAGMPGFAGGFLGVDVFFVISGYLITSILLDDLAADRFSILKFYDRRARRILPALFFVILCSLPFAWAWMLPWQLEDMGQSILAVVFFVSNIFFWIETDYFDGPAGEKPLLHTWSLSVEEQYYVLFPLLLWMLWRYARGKTGLVLAVIALASLIFSQWFSRHDPSGNFFLLPSRMWELLAGSLCALALQGRGGWSSNIASAAGLVMVLVAMATFTEATPMPSFYGLLPVGGVVLIILFAAEGTLTSRILSWRPFVGIGLVSYSAYLWHQPLFAFARIGRLEEPPLAVMLGLSAAALLLAWGTWAYVERPFRARSGEPFVSRRFVFLASGVAGAVLAMMAAVTMNLDGFPGRFDADRLASYEWDNKVLQKEAWAELKKRSGDGGYAITANDYDRMPWFTQDKRVKLLVFGNSHARDMFSALDSSPVITRTYQVALFMGQVYNTKDVDDLLVSPNFRDADFVLLASRQSVFSLQSMPRLVQRIKAAGKTPVIVLNTPEFAGDITFNLADSMILPKLDELEQGDIPGLAQEINDAYWDDHLIQRKGMVNTKLRAIARAEGVAVLDREKYICDAGKQVCYGVSSQLGKYFFDYGHTTAEGADFFGRRIAQVNWLAPLGRSLASK
ncbi:MAG: hypothetical protein DI533_03225 [Cereibacter sphaeroides]|uniref:Acyltransferase n=1 Tax=Cereibacter sphaeroides TaxID=1063 RepID=A0A2W5SIV1_CERSP|nr:MAG: hypothetical protein DI533_03225 [Cereibacter sphaeroides]